MFNNHCALFNNDFSVVDLTVGFLENINDVIYMYRCLQQFWSIGSFDMPRIKFSGSYYTIHIETDAEVVHVFT